jgi:hypothetical protein
MMNRVLNSRLSWFAVGAIFAAAVPARAEDLFFVASLSGPAESPPNNSPGTGRTVVSIDLDANTMRWQVDYAGLSAPSTGVHIHMPTSQPGAGVADGVTPHPPPADFPLGVVAGTYDRTFNLLDAGTYNMYYLAAQGNSPATARDSLLTALRTGRAYLNLHSQAFIDGEIRGFYLTDPTADFNRDGVVSAADLAAWRAAAPNSPAADANDDDATNGSDFLVWQRQLGQVATLGPPATPAPEPRSLALACLFASLAHRRRAARA